MNKNFIVLMFAAFVAFSCSKSEEKTATETAETSLVQEAQLLKCENGSTLTAIYFAEGDMVAVKIKKDAETEQKLSARGTTQNGDPFFGNGNYTWELIEEGKAGKLVDKNGNSCIYR